MARKRWSGEIKAKAAADLMAGMTVREVAAKYGMPLGTAATLTPTSKRGAVYVRKIADLNELHDLFLEQLSYNFAALKAMTELMIKDPKFAAMNGDKLAVVYGVVFDKTGKLASAAVAGPAMDNAIPDDAPRYNALTTDADDTPTPSETD